MSEPIQILLVEDSEDVPFVIDRELERHGFTPTTHRVETADAMRAALRSQHSWDLIIADYVLPEFDAISALHVLQETGRDIPFIVLSGNVGEDVVVEAMKAGAHDYIMKGNLTRLAPAIRRELREAADRAAHRKVEAALKESEDFSRAVLNSLGAEIAVLDHEGFLLAVNKAWNNVSFESATPGRVRCEVGANFLEACRQTAEAEDSTECRRACTGILSVLLGYLSDYTMEYSCPSSSGERWFLLFVTPLSERGGAVISHIDVTERKQTEQEVHLLAHALRCTNDCVCLTDLNNRILFVNEAFLQTYGYQLQELMGQPIEIVRAASNPVETLLEHAAQMPHGGWKGEMLHRRRDGSEFPVELSAALIRDKEGHPLAFITVAGDVTQRKTAEAALRESETRFRAVVESLTEGLLLTDDKDIILYANPRITEFTGYGMEELAGQPAYQLLLPREQWAAGLARLEQRRLGASERYEMRMLRKDGSSFWTEVGASPLRNQEGGIIGTVAAFTDITERRLAREALQKSESSLVLAQRIGHVGSWEADLNKGLLNWSAETFRIFGFDPHSFIPTRERFYHAVHPEDRDAVTRAVNDAIHHSRPYGIDHRIVRPDGSERFVHEQAELIIDAHGNIVRLVGTVQDITERRMLEEQFRQSQKMEAVGQLAGGIAHDFNNILTIIQGYTELLGFNRSLDTDARAQVAQVAQSADRAARLTRQILAFSRKQVIQLKTVSLNQLLESLSNMLQRLLGENNLLQLDLDSDLPSIRADAGTMEQILINLTVNARDAMPSGGQLSITTRSREIDEEYCRTRPDARPGDCACLIVSDTGCGMAPEVLRHIFEPFFTTKDVGKGTGLGLSTVYGIVRQHKGWIDVTSELHHGTTFEIFFPATARPDSALGGVEPRIPPSKGGRETILLVEDEPALRALSRNSLERYGYTILEASSGPEALRIWNRRQTPIDLLLTDVVMPGGMSGHDLALKLVEQNPSLKVLYTSGYSFDAAGSIHGSKLGSNFIPKPYLGATIARAVRDCLDGVD